ncbi:MAG: Crp/Fnr family transcriptional regulator [Bacteroidota bacterium]
MQKPYCKICDADACVNRCVLYDSLTEEQIEILRPGKEICEYRRKDILEKKGFTTPHIVFVCRGWAKVFIDTPYNKQYLIEVIGKERFITTSFVGFGHSLTTVMALTDLKICYFDLADMLKVAELNGKFAVALLKHFNINGTLRFQRLASIALKQTRGKLADAILYIYQNFQEVNMYDLISRKDLADLANISNENAIRTLRDFEEEGVVKSEKKTIIILDMERLEKISQRG